MDAIDRVLSQWDKEIPELNTVPMAMIGRLMRLSKILESRIAEVHKKYDLKMGEFDVLATLRRAGMPYRLTPSELLASMLLTSGAMTNRLDKLESKNLIVRKHSQADRRSVEVELTEKGLVLVDDLIVEHVREQEALVDGLSQTEQEQIGQCLKLWLKTFEG
ncbi:MarR family winged helix-turn-helix transcriptional regulator [Vibrio ziniensis]|uniref:MarR family transcriptional regulator n=1 Tax=Vibrio ziniensis TaxID=2711221 RepID=A0A6G7CPB3_9VIBR|nr:MarR family transcriptional regulator [Vibrio ziniensis]QIH43858.1 MarR family transcriptional regulator [Vibrio ziniensis]